MGQLFYKWPNSPANSVTRLQAVGLARTLMRGQRNSSVNDATHQRNRCCGARMEHVMPRMTLSRNHFSEGLRINLIKRIFILHNIIPSTSKDPASQATRHGGL